MIIILEQIEIRRKRRQRRAKEEKRREKRIEAEENRKIGKFDSPELHLESRDQFPGKKKTNYIHMRQLRWVENYLFVIIKSPELN